MLRDEQIERTSDRTRSGSSFVICTRNRAAELRHCLESLVSQTMLPKEAVIVDASDRPDQSWMRDLLSGYDISLVYLATTPGRTRQLNAGIQASSGDPILFVDDDVELDERFHEEILEAFASEGEAVGGVQGSVINDTLRPLPMRAFRTLFLMSRHTKDGNARLLPSGYYTTPARPSANREAEALRLCGLAFRRKIFDEFSFDEELHGYALKEDVDFSYRVSRRHRLLVAPAARFRHLKTTNARIDVRAKSRMHVVNNHRLFTKNLEGTAVQRLAFLWALCGRLIYELLRTVVKRDPDYVLGTLQGLREIARARGSWR